MNFTQKNGRKRNLFQYYCNSNKNYRMENQSNECHNNSPTIPSSVWKGQIEFYGGMAHCEREINSPCHNNEPNYVADGNDSISS